MQPLRLTYAPHPGNDLQCFVDRARQLLASEDEAERCRLEDALIAQLPGLRASGLFEIVQVRDPALRQLLADAGAPAKRTWPRLAVY